MATEEENQTPDAQAAATLSRSLSEVDDNPGEATSDDSDDSDSDSPQTEWLATGRQKRATAGNRMQSMLANEEPDSDLELLFAEDDDDAGFSDAEADASDVHMDSSSDDEDDNKADDDMEGEKELERQAKEKRTAQRKRKAQEAIPAKFRKKVRIDPTASTAPSTLSRRASAANTRATVPPPPPRPKKKSERASWLPTESDMPTRASSRSTTRESKEALHAQMKEREKRRLKQVAQMKKKAADLEMLKKPPMTQAERLAEAASVEERNSKSLNRWEEAEKQREEERRRKLAALNERTLRGPVLTFWSGKGEWVDGKLKKVGRQLVVVQEEKVKKPKKEKDKDKDKKGRQSKDQDGDTEKSADTRATTVNTAKDDGRKTSQDSTEPALKEMEKAVSNKAPAVAMNSEAAPIEAPKEGDTGAQTDNHGMMDIDSKEPAVEKSHAKHTTEPSKDVSKDSPSAENPKPSDATSADAIAQPHPAAEATTTTEGIANGEPQPIKVEGTKEASSQDSSEAEAAPSSTKQSSDQNKSANTFPAPTTTAHPDQSTSPSATTVAPSSNPELSATKPTAEATAATPASSAAPTPPVPAADVSAEAVNVTTLADPKSASPTEGEGTQPPLEKSHATRNAIIYQNFDENAIRDKQIQTQILFGRKMNKLPKPSPNPNCVITNHPARYRDPSTGLAYYNVAAYKEIQRLHRGDYRWSQILGAWVGSARDFAARGVPERFLNPLAESPNKKKEVTEQQQKPKDAGGGDAKPSGDGVKGDVSNGASAVTADATKQQQQQQQQGGDVEMADATHTPKPQPVSSMPAAASQQE